MLCRGMVNIDAIIDPSIYPDNRIEKIKDRNECICFLVDTACNTIMGIKFLHLNDKAISFIGDNVKRMDDLGKDTMQCQIAYYNSVIPYTHKELVKRAVYLGKSDGSVATNNLYNIV